MFTPAYPNTLSTLLQVVRELESGRDRLQEELMVTAQLVTQLEAKLREALRKCDQAETEAQVQLVSKYENVGGCAKGEWRWRCMVLKAVFLAMRGITKRRTKVFLNDFSHTAAASLVSPLHQFWWLPVTPSVCPTPLHQVAQGRRQQAEANRFAEQVPRRHFPLPTQLSPHNLSPHPLSGG